MEFADVLGPACRRSLGRPGVIEALMAEVQGGRDLEDAVLAHLHGQLLADRQLSDEFAAYFLYDLMKMGKTAMTTSSKLRRFLDTGDLVLSVFGDMWGDIATMQFESRRQFKSLFAQRMGWKAADKARRLSTVRRAEDRRVDLPTIAFEAVREQSEQAPLPAAIREEERERLILILLRLEERDRKLLTLHLKGRSTEEIGRELDLSPEAARKALWRAIRKARALSSARDTEAAN